MQTHKHTKIFIILFLWIINIFYVCAYMLSQVIRYSVRAFCFAIIFIYIKLISIYYYKKIMEEEKENITKNQGKLNKIKTLPSN